MKINNPKAFKKKSTFKEAHSKKGPVRQLSPSRSQSKQKSKKSKSKAKGKSQQFNPLEYLNTLIELTNKNNSTLCSTKKYPHTSRAHSSRNNHKSAAKRDLSSALTMATPGLEKTISSVAKIRSKSSYSQCRKRASSGLRGIIQINLDSVITEEENHIKFTSSSGVSTPSHTETQKTIKKDKGVLNINFRKSHVDIDADGEMRQNHKSDQYYATVIQRAWRSYQTYKMVKKYYQMFKKQKKALNRQRNKQQPLETRQQQREKDNHFNTKHKHQEFLHNYNILCCHNQQEDLTNINHHYQFLGLQQQPQTSNISELQMTQKIGKNHHRGRTNKDQAGDRLQVTSFLINNQPKEQSPAQELEFVNNFLQNDAEQEDLDMTQKLRRIQQFVQESGHDANTTDLRSSAAEEITALMEGPTKQYDRNRVENKHKQNMFSQSPQNKDYQSHSPQKTRQINSNNLNQNLQRISITPNYPKFDQKSNSNKPQPHNYPSQQNITHHQDISLLVSQQTDKYNEILSLLEANQKSQQYQQSCSSRQLLNQLMKKFEQNKNKLEMEISQRLSSINIVPAEQKCHRDEKSMEYLCFDSQELFMKNHSNNNDKNGSGQGQVLNDLERSFLKGQNQQRRSQEIDHIDIQKIINDDSSSESSSSMYSLYKDEQTKKLYDYRLKLLEKSKIQQMTSLQKLKSEHKLSQKSFHLKLQQIQGRHFREKRQIQKSKSKYQRVLNKVKNQAIQFQRLLIQKNRHERGSEGKEDKEGSSLGGTPLFVRQSFSTETIVLKSILAEPTFIEFDDVEIIRDFESDNNDGGSQIDREQIVCGIEEQKEDPNSALLSEQKEKLLNVNQLDTQRQQYSSRKDSQQEQQQAVRVRQTEQQPQIASQINQKSEISEDRELLSSENSIAKQNQAFSVSEHIDRCTDQISDELITSLFEQLLQEIYLNQNILRSFKPYIEQVFEFKQIHDSDILQFVDNLNEFFPSKEDLFRRINQKINPNSMEILRLIRDFEFEIDQYELVLSQDVFKKARKNIQAEYALKISDRRKKRVQQMNQKTEMISKSATFNRCSELLQKVSTRESEKSQKIEKYINYERDLNIMYMKAAFNCLNEYLIEEKSHSTHMNSRSTISAGELSLAIKQFNHKASESDLEAFLRDSVEKIKQTLGKKCMIPNFKSYKDVDSFQKQMLHIVKAEIHETEYKWVNFMDEVLEIWNELAEDIVQTLFKEAVADIFLQIETG